jgi:hypothetical protein
MSVLLISDEPELIGRADHCFELPGELHVHGEAA